ncbi:hypothetical protein AQS8620_02179 [Aquimixticola soesokkakensis]|uniref:Integrase core domain protein n=1 Tax=Aquimixticola soesokkakensis TaxID=1519096 RepID=A0A1Y5T2C8_9RHOB|nr:hypothetical protein AQS8620_02179 [Aquimixticola soesokkakensis]
MAIWRRKPGPGLLIHSDQGAQFTSREWAFRSRELSGVAHMHVTNVAQSYYDFIKGKQAFSGLPTPREAPPIWL